MTGRFVAWVDECPKAHCVYRTHRVQHAHCTPHAPPAPHHTELLPNPDDQRILQLELASAGRSYLDAARSIEAGWLAELLNGLGEHQRANTPHLVRVIRQRLERAARELARSKRVPLQSEHHLGESS